MASSNPIYVTQPYLPPLEEYIPYLTQIWERRVLTNGGPFHRQLEESLCAYLGVKYLSLFTNGTVALVTALQALQIKGEVITTPYSFVATAHSLLWNGIKPVFVDVDPITLNLDPRKIEAAITPNTTAILPVHVYGTPCDSEAIKQIADRYNLKVIYDAAHAFGVEDSGGSILRHGDLAVLSFHATKVFNTFEGGAIISHDAATKHHIDNLKNFGFEDEVKVVEPGINGKMSEMQAAMGLLQLKYMPSILADRAAAESYYRERLDRIKGIHCLSIPTGIKRNHSYFPILVQPSFPVTRDNLYRVLNTVDIHPRRYFYPLISDFPMYRDLPSSNPDLLPNASLAAQQVLCLPLYPALNRSQIDKVVDCITQIAI